MSKDVPNIGVITVGRVIEWFEKRHKHRQEEEESDWLLCMELFIAASGSQAGYDLFGAHVLTLT